MIKLTLVPLILSTLVFSSFSETRWQTTRNGWTSSGVCQLKSNKISVEVHPYYADVVEEAEITATGDVWSGDPNSLEITGSFTLSSGTALRSMLLWNGTKILKAKLRLRADADSLYEDVVNREVVRDPALIEYTGNNTYRFKIFPVAINESRKIRIMYTAPLQMTNEDPRFFISPAFTLGTQSTPSQIPVEITRSDCLFEKCILQHGTVRKTVQFGGI